MSAGLLATSSLSYAEEAPPPAFPRPSCTQHITDDAGDAIPKFLGNDTTGPVFGNNPALDITALHMRVTSTELQLFLGIDEFDDPAEMATYAAAYRYTFTAKLGTKVLTYTAQQISPGHPLLPGDHADYPKAFVTDNQGAITNIPGSSGRFFAQAAPAKSYVVFTSPRAAVETALGAPIVATDVFSNIIGSTETWIYSRGTLADENVTPAEQSVHTAGNDFCFGPAPTTLSALTASPVQYGDTTTLAVTLKGGDKDEALLDQPVVFGMGDTSLATATTAAEGLARTTARVSIPAGNHAFVASYAGTPELRAATLSGTLVVKPEVTVFSALAIGKPSSKARTATATVLDDDKTPVAGRKVEWWVNSKKVATTTTDASGKTTYKALQPGQTVQAKFPVVTGMYAASSSKAVKV